MVLALQAGGVGLTVLTVTATSRVIHFDLLLESIEGGDDRPRTSN